MILQCKRKQNRIESIKNNNIQHNGRNNKYHKTENKEQLTQTNSTFKPSVNTMSKAMYINETVC